MLAPLVLLAASSEAYTLQGLARTSPRCHPRQAAARVAPDTCRMNLGERFVRLVKSNVNEALNKLEDPEKVLTQAVADMQKDLTKVRQAYAEVSASNKRMTEQARLAEAEAAKWYERAQLALEKGEDDLAREALTRRQQQTEMADSLKQGAESGELETILVEEQMRERARKALSLGAETGQPGRITGMDKALCTKMVLRQRLDDIGKMRALCRNCEEFNREFAPAHAHRIRNATNVIKAVMQRVELHQLQRVIHGLVP